MSCTDSFSRDSLHAQAARARKLHRLRQVVDAAQDPSDLFEATAELIEAMMDAGASFCCSSETTAAAATPASSCSTQVLALNLCAALSEPVLRHGDASSTSLASGISGAGSGSLLQSSPSPGRGNTPDDGSMQPSKRRKSRSPPVEASAGTAGQLQTCYSLPYPASTGLELAGDPADSLAAAQWLSADLELRRGLSTAQLELSTHQPQQSPPCSAHSCLQLQGALQQQQQQLMHNRQSLQELLRQRLLRTASLDLQPQAQQLQQQQDPLYQQLQYRQQQQMAGLQRHAQQELLNLHQQRQGQQQGLGQQPDTDQNTDLLDCLKRAMAVTIVRNGMTQQA